MQKLNPYEQRFREISGGCFLFKKGKRNTKFHPSLSRQRTYLAFSEFCMTSISIPTTGSAKLFLSKLLITDLSLF